MDNCFECGDGEAVRYENVDEPVQLDAGDVGGRWWLAGEHSNYHSVSCLRDCKLLYTDFHKSIPLSQEGAGGT